MQVMIREDGARFNPPPQTRVFGAVLLCFVALLAFSGCDLLRALGFGEDDPAPEEPAHPYVAKGVPVDPENQSIKAKFGVTLPGTAGVNVAFRELSAYIKNGGLDVPADCVIKLGDWIDLDGGLQIAAYDDQGFDSNKVPNWDTLISDDQGKLSRLIVVGINSFQSVQAGYQYPAGEDTPPAHVVFQFQNITHGHPVSTKLNGAATGGYPDSAMREYLTPVKREDLPVEGSGKFLGGLTAAGVPVDVLWGPARVMAAYGVAPDTETIHDLLWLPTAGEMGLTSGLQETSANQTRLTYYAGKNERIKYDKSGKARYWVASIESGGFSSMTIGGATTGMSGLNLLGVSPAFCVQ